MRPFNLLRHFAASLTVNSSVAPESRGSRPFRLDYIVQQILGLFQVTSAAGIKIKISLDRRNDSSE